jgi:hypothetical protein
MALLDRASNVSSQLLEETLTDMNVLELRFNHPKDVITKTFTKPQEAITGADWEWWLTGPSNQWLGFRLQAKVVELQSSTYKHLHYKGKQSNAFQSDVLIQSALSNNPPLIPLYCLYSFWDSQAVQPNWPCGTYNFNVKSYGCSLMSAFQVRHLRKNKNKNDIGSLVPYMKPWQCLICCHAFGGGDLPQRAWAYWDAQLRSSDQVATINRDGPDEDGALSNLAGRYREISPVGNPPDYVLRLIEGELIEPPTEGLRHITVFREAG